ncbi:hypothetical protein HKI87_09g56370 [Chloropicon roscoffensis]|uniref:Uncharacterized protein n=1 Tax=Chloropicon roscoffensis TaxID=1461544 RepID=A0AAX4PD53_9CHLO
MSSPTVVMSERTKRSADHRGVLDPEFSFSSPAARQQGGKAGAGTSRHDPDVLQSVQRELLMLRHHLSPSKVEQAAVSRSRSRSSPNKPASPKRPQVLFGNVLEHNGREQKIVLQPRSPDLSGEVVSAEDVRQFVGNIATLLTSTDPSLSLGTDLRSKLSTTDFAKKSVLATMQETTLAVREMCRLFCKQRVQLAETVAKRAHLDAALAGASLLTKEGVALELERERQRSHALEQELARARARELELEGEVQLAAMGAELGASADVAASGIAVGSSSHPRVTLETLLEAQASQSKQLTEVLEAVRTNQRDIANLKTKESDVRQAAATARRRSRAASVSAAERPPAPARRSSKMERLRQAATASTDSEQDSFDDDDSDGGRAGEEGESVSPAAGGKGGLGFADVVNAARGQASSSSWGKIKGKMPMIRRRHGIHQSISLPQGQAISENVVKKKSLRGGLNLFGDSDENVGELDARQQKMRQVPRHMSEMSVEFDNHGY